LKDAGILAFGMERNVSVPEFVCCLLE